jgi:group I intron endonuclease
MIIYKTINSINGKIYIGKDKYNNPHYLGSGLLIKKAIKKYGKRNFKKEILEKCETIEELEKREVYYQNKYSECFAPIGYNILHGSFGGDIFTNHPDKENIRLKISKSSSSRSQEIRNKISESLKGRLPWNKNKKNCYSEKTIRKMKMTHLGENNIMFGKHHTIETKEKIRKSLKGHVPWNKGKKGIYTKEALKRMSKSGGKHKGKTYEEIYGSERANQERQKRSDAWRK